MKLLYFAWIKTKVGIAEEEIELPEQVTTVAGLLDWLAGRGPAFAEALEDRQVIRVAVNQEFADSNDSVSAADEVALFPPVTGG